MDESHIGILTDERSGVSLFSYEDIYKNSRVSEATPTVEGPFSGKNSLIKEGKSTTTATTHQLLANGIKKF